MASKLELLQPTLERGFPPGEDIFPMVANPERVKRLKDALGEIAEEEELIVEMVGDQDFRIERKGFDGFVDGWREWAETFESFRVEVDDVVESGPHLVTLVRLIGRPHGADTEIENEGAGVWTFEEERLVRVEFHLNRDTALRAAGLEPQSGQE